MMNSHREVWHELEKHVGRANAVTRAQLCRRLNLRDREIRDAIEFLRRVHLQGGRICSSSSTAGYWLSESVDEIREVYSERMRHGLKIINNARLFLHNGEEYYARLELPDVEFEQMELI